MFSSHFKFGAYRLPNYYKIVEVLSIGSPALYPGISDRVGKTVKG